MLLSVLICFYGKKISVSEFLRSARSSFLLFPIKKENRQRLYNLLSIFILKLINFQMYFAEISTKRTNTVPFSIYFHIFFSCTIKKTTFPVFPAGLFCPLTSSRFQYPKPRKSVKSRTKEFAKFLYKVIIALDINNRMHVLRTFYCHESRKNKAGTYHV